MRRDQVLALRWLALAGVLGCRGKKRLLSWLLFDALRLYPTLLRNCDWHGKVVRRFETPRREVWLTIDDGPDAHDTPTMLDLLRSHQAKADFFVVGRRAQQWPQWIHRIVEEGHGLGNHTYDHPVGSWWTLPPFMVAAQIQKGNAVLESLTGKLPRFFRSPVGMTPASVHPELKKHRQILVGWSLNIRHPLDQDFLKRKFEEQIFPGAILLMHEGGGGGQRLRVMEQVLLQLTRMGYRCVRPSVDQLRFDR